VIVGLVLFLSIGTAYWFTLGHQLMQDAASHQLKVLEGRANQNHEVSMKAAYPKLEPLIQNCSGIMGDAEFIGAFTRVPFDRIYDEREIPPFGTLDQSSYHGLNPGRIDCVLVSYFFLSENSESETNIYMRYEHYILPYARQLEALGAKTYELPSYGYVTVLKHPQ
jgi:hypothetical protein